MVIHCTQWQRIQQAVRSKRIPSAWLFWGSAFCHLDEFTIQAAQLILCHTPQESSLSCTCYDCTMVLRREHPDMIWIQPEKNSAVIKIDQIREIQSSLYISSQRGVAKLIVLQGADKLNVSAANALLKIVEEPPKQAHFFLLAEQIEIITPTLLSRCQSLHFSVAADHEMTNLLDLAQFYPEGSERRILVEQVDNFIQQLILVIEKKHHPCAVVDLWSKYEIKNVLWLLYLIYSQVNFLHVSTIPSDNSSGPSLIKLKNLLSARAVFNQIDKINHLSMTLNRASTLNRVLSLEDLLLSL